VPTESPTRSTDTTTDTHAVTQALTEAAAAAGYAPSIRNTQPWRWRLTGNTLNLHLEPGRVPDETDPDTRLATLSCGAALNHARVSLAGQGWRATVIRLPNPSDPQHLAQLHADGRAPTPVDPLTVLRSQTIRLRDTDRRMAPGTPVGDGALRAIATAIEAEGAHLRILAPDQIVNLATAADQTRRTATYSILHGPDDQPLSWLRAGEALSAAWLTATEFGVSIVPSSTTVEPAAAGQPTLAALTGLDHPYLVLRFGSIEATNPATPHPPRRPADQIIET
jgi:nitroreductase